MAGMFVPQMVTPVDTSGLAALGESIGQWRQESAIADVLKGLDPADPHSRARTLSDLRARGDRASRDMADRLEGSWNTQAYQQGQLGLGQERNRLAREQFQYGKETTEEDRRLAAQREGTILQGLQQQPPPVAAPPARAEPKLPPTEDWPDEDQPAAPSPQRISAAAEPVDPRGTPQERAANNQRIIQGQRPVPPATSGRPSPLPPAPLGAMPPSAPAPFADRFAASAEGGLGELPPPPPSNVSGTGGPPPVPAELAPQPPGAQYGAPAPQMASSAARPARLPAQIPVTPPTAAPPSPQMSEAEATGRLNYLNNLHALADKHPGYKTAIEGQIGQLKAYIKEQFTDPRDTERAVATERRKEATKLDLKSRDELGKAYSAKLDTINAVKPDINRIQWLINQEKFRGGPGGKPIEYVYGLGQSLNNIARFVLPEGWTPVSREAMDKWAGGDEKAFMEEARGIMKGFAAHSANLLKGPTSDKDLKFSEAQNANPDMSVTGVNRMINRIKVEHSRIERNHQVVFDGIRRDRTHAEIENNLRRIGQIPMFVDKEGNPTEVGRSVDVTQGRPGAGTAVAAPAPVDKTPAARGGASGRAPTAQDEGATVYPKGDTEKRNPHIIRNGVPVPVPLRNPGGA